METSAEGVFAVGDARVTPLRQVITAAADGAVAAVAAEKYLIEEEGFRDTVLLEQRPVAVMFWTPMSQKCLDMMPMMESAMGSFGDQIKLWKLDTYRNQRVARRYGVSQNPTILFFNNGEMVSLLCEDEINDTSIKTALNQLLS